MGIAEILLFHHEIWEEVTHTKTHAFKYGSFLNTSTDYLFMQIVKYVFYRISSE